MSDLHASSIAAAVRDDRYFGAADRVVRLEAGKIVDITRTQAGAAHAPARVEERPSQPAATSPSASQAAPAARRAGAAS